MAPWKAPLIGTGRTRLLEQFRSRCPRFHQRLSCALTPVRSHSAEWGYSTLPELALAPFLAASAPARLSCALLPCSSRRVDRTLVSPAAVAGRPTLAMPGGFGPQEPGLKVRENRLIATAPAGLWLRMGRHLQNVRYFL